MDFKMRHAKFSLEIIIVKDGMPVDIVNLMVLYLVRRGVLNENFEIIEEKLEEQLFPTSEDKKKSSVDDLRSKLNILADMLQLPHAAVSHRSFRKGFAVFRALEYINRNPLFTENLIFCHLVSTYNWTSKQSLKYLSDSSSEYYKAVARVENLIKEHKSYDSFEQYLFLTDMINFEEYYYPSVGEVEKLAGKMQNLVKDTGYCLLNKAQQYLMAAILKNVVNNRTSVFPKTARTCHLAPKIVNVAESIKSKKYNIVYELNCAMCGDKCVRNSPTIKAYKSDPEILQIQLMTFSGDKKTFVDKFLSIVATDVNQKKCLFVLLNQMLPE